MGDTTQQRLQDQLDAITQNAGVIVDHINNFDQHRDEIEAGEREPDDFLTEDTENEADLHMTWEEDILSIDERVQFDFLFAFGGPNVWAEVVCIPTKHQHWTEYDIRSITLKGAWGGDNTEREIYEGDPLWFLIEQAVETLGQGG